MKTRNDPATGRPYGDHGTADDAIAFVLDNPGRDIEAESFLRYWDVGDLRGWPEYYAWLAARERARPTLTDEERRRIAGRGTLVGIVALLATIGAGALDAPWWPVLPAMLIVMFCVMTRWPALDPSADGRAARIKRKGIWR